MLISTKLSKSKVYRFYKKNEELWSETKLKNGKRLFPTEHAIHLLSAVDFSNAIKLNIFLMRERKRLP